MLKVCAVLDAATEAYGQPVFAVSVGVAIRSFIDEARRPDSSLSRHPHDYSLYHIADYDERSGLFIGVTPARLLMKGVEVPSEGVSA